MHHQQHAREAVGEAAQTARRDQAERVGSRARVVTRRGGAQSAASASAPASAGPRSTRSATSGLQ